MLKALLPEIVLTVFAGLTLVLDLLIPKKRWLLVWGIFSVAATGIVLAKTAFLPPAGGMVLVDALSQFAKGLILCAMGLVFLLSWGYQRKLDEPRLGIYTSLLLFATIGMMLMVSAGDLIMLLVALELIGIPSFVLAGFLFREARSSEGAIKYFLLGAFSTALAVYGLSLIYGLTGTTDLSVLASRMPEMSPLFAIGLLLAVAGLLFEISLVPFHAWVPESYEGAPTPVTAYLSVAPKTATMVALLRIFTAFFPLENVELGLLMAAIAALTMSVGNLAAIFQNNVKRMLAYSSIAQMGYVLIGVVAQGRLGSEGVLLYLLAYTFMNLGAFAIVIALSNELGSDDLQAYSGLSKRSPFVSLLLVVFLLSLAGIPPLAGFVGKFYVFASALEGGRWVWLAVIGVLNTVISVYYYLRLAHQMYFVAPLRPEALRLDPVLKSAIALTAGLTLMIGLYPEPFVQMVKSAATYVQQESVK